MTSNKALKKITNLAWEGAFERAKIENEIRGYARIGAIIFSNKIKRLYVL